jgi:cell division protein FtsZ
MGPYYDETTSPRRVKVIGVGGGGCHAINTMIHAGVEGVEFIAVHTDEHALRSSLALTTLQLGGRLTNARGAGANPEMGHRAALEELDRLAETPEGADLVFVTAGMGGGTGTGAAPVIARMAKARACLTIAAVTKPFRFEGRWRLLQAEAGLRMPRRTVDMLITIPYQRLLGAVGKRCSMRDALRMGNEALRHARRDPRPSGQLPHVSTGDDARSAVDASGARTALRHGPPTAPLAHDRPADRAGAADRRRHAAWRRLSPRGLASHEAAASSLAHTRGLDRAG